MKSLYKLKGVVQHYSWGGTGYLPQLLHVQNPDNKPFAEYWLGAHPSAPATLEGEARTLNQFIADNPAATLGAGVAQRFGSLSYLFKILDVRQMLSIQVHPSKAAAEDGFEEENKKGTPLSAPHRNYKDRNHKPELMVALSDFWLLHGFKPEAELRAVLNRVEALRFLVPVFDTGGYQAVYEEVMTMPQEKVDETLRPYLQTIVPQYEQNVLAKSSEDFWAARAALSFCKDTVVDRGIFSVYLFNLLHLKEGEAIYQAAGLPHAYLEGQNAEVMAASDNVLRAGLTDKHVDVPELMKHVRFEATHPQIICAGDGPEQTFAAPVDDFLLKKQTIESAGSLMAQTATILFVYEGAGRVATGAENVEIKRGEAVLLLPGSPVSIEPAVAPLTLFSVAAAVHKN